MKKISLILSLILVHNYAANHAKATDHDNFYYQVFNQSNYTSDQQYEGLCQHNSEMIPIYYKDISVRLAYGPAYERSFLLPDNIKSIPPIKIGPQDSWSEEFFRLDGTSPEDKKLAQQNKLFSLKSFLGKEDKDHLTLYLTATFETKDGSKIFNRGQFAQSYKRELISATPVNLSSLGLNDQERSARLKQSMDEGYVNQELVDHFCRTLVVTLQNFEITQEGYPYFSYTVERKFEESGAKPKSQSPSRYL